MLGGILIGEGEFEDRRIVPLVRKGTSKYYQLFFQRSAIYSQVRMATYAFSLALSRHRAQHAHVLYCIVSHYVDASKPHGRESKVDRYSILRRLLCYLGHISHINSASWCLLSRNSTRHSKLSP